MNVAYATKDEKPCEGFYAGRSYWNANLRKAFFKSELKRKNGQLNENEGWLVSHTPLEFCRCAGLHSLPSPLDHFYSINRAFGMGIMRPAWDRCK